MTPEHWEYPSAEDRSIQRLRNALRSAMDHTARAIGENILSASPSPKKERDRDRVRIYQTMEELLKLL